MLEYYSHHIRKTGTASFQISGFYEKSNWAFMHNPSSSMFLLNNLLKPLKHLIFVCKACGHDALLRKNNFTWGGRLQMLYLSTTDRNSTCINNPENINNLDYLENAITKYDIVVAGGGMVGGAMAASLGIT